MFRFFFFNVMIKILLTWVAELAGHILWLNGCSSSLNTPMSAKVTDLFIWSVLLRLCKNVEKLMRSFFIWVDPWFYLCLLFLLANYGQQYSCELYTIFLTKNISPMVIAIIVVVLKIIFLFYSLYIIHLYSING